MPKYTFDKKRIMESRVFYPYLFDFAALRSMSASASMSITPGSINLAKNLRLKGKQQEVRLGIAKDRHPKEFGPYNRENRRFPANSYKNMIKNIFLY